MINTYIALTYLQVQPKKKTHTNLSHFWIQRKWRGWGAGDWATALIPAVRRQQSLFGPALMRGRTQPWGWEAISKSLLEAFLHRQSDSSAMSRSMWWGPFDWYPRDDVLQPRALPTWLFLSSSFHTETHTILRLWKTASSSSTPPTGNLYRVERSFVRENRN